MTDPFPLTHECYEEKLGHHDATWPTDPAVPELPPQTDDPGLNPEAFLTTHYTNTLYPPKVASPSSSFSSLTTSLKVR
jgi:hypothetical protein